MLKGPGVHQVLRHLGLTTISGRWLRHVSRGDNFPDTGGTSHVQTRMDEVSAELDKVFKKAKKEKKHLAPFEAILKALHVLEDEFWSLIILMSNAAAAAAFNDMEEEATQAYGDMLKFWTTNKQGERVRHLFGILK